MDTHMRIPKKEEQAEIRARLLCNTKPFQDALKAKHRGKKNHLLPFRLLYGPLWEGSLFDPNFHNIWHGVEMSRTHHNSENDRAMTKDAFIDLDYAFCTELAYYEDGQPIYTRDGERVRCGMRFRVKSDGCGRHPRVQNYKAFYEALRSGQAEASNWDDPEWIDTSTEANSQTEHQSIVDRLEEDAEKQLLRGGYVKRPPHLRYEEAKKDIRRKGLEASKMARLATRESRAIATKKTVKHANCTRRTKWGHRKKHNIDAHGPLSTLDRNALDRPRTLIQTQDNRLSEKDKVFYQLSVSLGQFEI